MNGKKAHRREGYKIGVMNMKAERGATIGVVR